MMKRILLTISLLLLATPALAWNWPTIVAMRSGAGGDEGIIYGTGDILSERFGSTGSDGSDESWTETTEGTGVYNDDDQTLSGTTGFEGDHLTASYSSGQANALIDLGSAYTTIYFRIYVRVNSESWTDGANESIVTFNKDGESWTNEYFSLGLAQVATDQLQFKLGFNGGAFVSTGSNTFNITPETTYKVEGKVVDNGASDEIEWWVNDTSIGARTGDFGTFDSTGIRDVQLGVTYSTQAVSVSLDTFDISSSARLVDE